MKQRRSNQGLLLLLLFVSLLFLSTGGFAQCEMKFEYEVEKASTIKVKLAKGSGVYSISLYDIYKDQKIKSLELSANAGGEVSFTDVPSSTYLIYVSNKECNKQLYINSKPIEIAHQEE